MRKEDPVWKAKKDFIKRLLDQSGVNPAEQGAYFIFAYNVYRGKQYQLPAKKSLRDQIEKWVREGLRRDLLEQIARIVG